jgi:hypothetical protein
LSLMSGSVVLKKDSVDMIDIASDIQVTGVRLYGWVDH